MVHGKITLKTETEVQNNSDRTAPSQARFFCRLEIVELLRNAGSDPDSLNSRGFTPLDAVPIEFDDALEETYRHVYESLWLKFDAQFVRQSRH
jgi:hypothetical protein